MLRCTRDQHDRVVRGPSIGSFVTVGRPVLHGGIYLYIVCIAVVATAVLLDYCASLRMRISIVYQRAAYVVKHTQWTPEPQAQLGPKVWPGPEARGPPEPREASRASGLARYRATLSPEPVPSLGGLLCVSLVIKII